MLDSSTPAKKEIKCNVKMYKDYTSPLVHREFFMKIQIFDEFPNNYLHTTGCLSTECLFHFDYGNDTISN